MANRHDSGSTSNRQSEHRNPESDDRMSERSEDVRNISDEDDDDEFDDVEDTDDEDLEDDGTA